jgi:hypothetical protein
MKKGKGKPATGDQIFCDMKKGQVQIGQQDKGDI